MCCRKLLAVALMAVMHDKFMYRVITCNTLGTGGSAPIGDRRCMPGRISLAARVPITWTAPLRPPDTTRDRDPE